MYNETGEGRQEGVVEGGEKVPSQKTIRGCRMRENKKVNPDIRK